MTAKQVFRKRPILSLSAWRNDARSNRSPQRINLKETFFQNGNRRLLAYFVEKSADKIQFTIFTPH